MDPEIEPGYYREEALFDWKNLAVGTAG